MTITLILVLLTCLISYQAINNPAMKQQLTLYPYAIKENKEYFRFLTSGLVHSGWMHLIVNMYVLYIFGEYIEQAFGKIFGEVMGRIAFLLFYLSAIVVSSLPDYFRYQNNRFYSALGASGATSAIVFAFVLFNPWEWFIFPPLPALLFAIAFLWYSSYLDKKGADNIAHNVHFWGAIYGLFFLIVSIAILQPSLFDVIFSKLLQGPKPFPLFN